MIGAPYKVLQVSFAAWPLKEQPLELLKCSLGQTCMIHYGFIAAFLRFCMFHQQLWRYLYLTSNNHYK